ncbi:MAG TPA: permease [Candidatus Krumholzibacteria bacterium]|nr:permease [Candidatus Krumholzibacteria bacterium]
MTRALPRFAAGVAAFLLLYHLPVDRLGWSGPAHEALALTRWYAREHVLLCLVPAFFIAGGIATLAGQAAVLKYLGGGARRLTAYAVASVAGVVLAVCSCTVLPLFAGIYALGAGLGPATAFLYSGPAVSVLAIILTANVLGPELGLARALFAVAFSVMIGLGMETIFRRDERAAAPVAMPDDDDRPVHRTVLTLAALVAVLIFANWGGAVGGFAAAVHAVKWIVTAVAAAALGLMLAGWWGVRWWRVLVAAALTWAASLLRPGDAALIFSVGAAGFSWILATGPATLRAWSDESWGFARKILPLLLAGVLASGLLLGRPEHEGLIPSDWIARAVGGNGLPANLLAAVSGAFMYFATLTEVPILQGLLGAGMGRGPALALLLAGPAVSLPSLLVLRSVLGGRRTGAFLGLVVGLSAAAGWVFGLLT